MKNFFKVHFFSKIMTENENETEKRLALEKKNADELAAKQKKATEEKTAKDKEALEKHSKETEKTTSTVHTV